MSLFFADVTNPDSRADYLLSVPPIIPQPIESADFELAPSVPMIFEALPPIQTANNPVATIPTVPIAPKRIYVKVTQIQRDALRRYYSEHGETWSVLTYSTKTGIKPKQTSAFIKILRDGGSIDLSSVKKGRKKLITVNGSIRLTEMIRENNKITLTEMSTKLATPEPINEEEDNQGEEEEEDNGVIDASISTISRHLRFGMEKDGQPAFTIKLASHREPASNTAANKEKRIEVIQKLNLLESRGHMIVYVDESHWEVGLVHRHLRSPRGEKAFDNCNSRALSITALTSISTLGVGYTELIHGSVNAEIFQSYLSGLLNSLNGTGSHVIYLDNASIHHDPGVAAKVSEAGHQLVFGAPYSPELNPIEKVFGFWKTRAENDLKIFTNLEDLVNKIGNHFRSINPMEVRATIQGTIRNVWPKVMNRDDI
ncbi:hypothetical protein WA158_003372 [Blastocystis sp. Blastoise]